MRHCLSIMAAAVTALGSPARAVQAQRPTPDLSQAALGGLTLKADIAFPAGNGGATIGGKSVSWGRAVTLSADQAKRTENYRCVFDLSYHVSNVGPGPAGLFSNLVRPVAVVAPAGSAAQEPAAAQTGLSLGPMTTKVVQAEISLAPGSWFVVVKGDAEGQVSELDETGNNEGRLGVTLAGTCDGTFWGVHGENYRSYLLEHLVARNVRVAGIVVAPGSTLHLGASKLSPAGAGKCLVGVDYQVENQGTLATQPFTSLVRIGDQHDASYQQVAVAALPPGSVAAADAVVGLPAGSTSLAVYPVVVTSGSGVEQLGTHGVEASVALDGGCSGK